MEAECGRITKVILPAIRASVSETMSKKYKYSQQDVASDLGIVQVAVSKYLNGHYSSDVGKLKTYIDRGNMCNDIAKKFVEGKQKSARQAIDDLCVALVDVNISMI